LEIERSQKRAVGVRGLGDHGRLSTEIASARQ
jgi:hypothetical protein